MEKLHRHIVINDKKNAVRQIEGKLEEILSKLHLSESDKHNLIVCTTEAVINAMVHGNKNDPSKKITVDLDYANNRVTISVKDEGSGFDPRKLPNPLLPENLLKPSGRGILIMKSLMDSVNFEFTSSGTKTIMTKKIKIEKKPKKGRDK
jgi:serine/threonine-protein kinase RsbW